MAIFRLQAVPGHFAKNEIGRAMVLAITAKPYAKVLVTTNSLDALRQAIAAFGSKTVTTTGGASFLVSVTVASGRKPSGFDAANRKNNLGEEVWMRTSSSANHDDPGLTATATPPIAT
jgi:hypothetical protein